MSIHIELKMMRNYEILEDMTLVELAHTGDDESLNHLINRYRNFVRAKARPYFLIGAEREDLIQEGMIGLYKAIRDFKEDKTSSFRSFAELCITRQILTAIKTATRQKHGPLNSSVSLDKPLSDDESNYTLLDLLSEENRTNPEMMLINREKSLDMQMKISELLSELERNVLNLHLEGKSYLEISNELQTHVKSIDNALQRVKKKLERNLQIKQAI
ncbi:RNA polymerase sporulation sigma factor SigH [Priestia flexa]|jgi:RNA polymerase sporulation-specific sigma factor|uniref:RNA polymerase sporulation sigma factor SigH n=1 Tax=Priestia flexa TaxID=86664 RepID=A0A1N6V768_9BACI|nr:MULTISPECIES: RNA polymerase sporulation sigma factor SigH [Bacillaceae]OZT14542.1 RNA polymerase sporulation sigma factor SigH [Priestia aryabhattai]USY57006.1 RNA polymerase sporulation sigma factor SigH [Bacillus sp. 1780r2a1]AQX54833.1 RNA polymerase factor sigma-70 [Priestia flexa]MBN8251257.1 RNA polymerase sporulation sigma factor SigH [Priestia flexa]MBN8434480.1 RNA polymerase sporulation sigma factor SigH [Priestia flexa]